MYAVNGVFFDNEGEMFEEQTQVVRLMFKTSTSFQEQATAMHCEDVLRAILFWTINRQGRLDEHKQWGKAEQSHFVKEHEPWPKRKRAFVRRYFVDIAKETAKWTDDCRLFAFYLARKFADKVLAEKKLEKEIWVTSFFNLTVNVIKRVEE